MYCTVLVIIAILFFFFIYSQVHKAFASLSSILSHTYGHPLPCWMRNHRKLFQHSVRFWLAFLPSYTSCLVSLSLSLALIIHASIIYLFFQVYIEPRGIFQFNIIIMNRKSNSFSVVIFTFFFWFTFHVLYLFNVHAWANLKKVHFRLLFHRFKNSKENFPNRFWVGFVLYFAFSSCSVSGGHIF